MILLDTCVGYVIARFLAGKKTGQRGRIKSIRLRVKKKYVVHFHHWFLSLLILGGLFWADVQSMIAYGFFTGFALQGLTYRDFYKLVYKDTDASSSY